MNKLLPLLIALIISGCCTAPVSSQVVFQADNQGIMEVTQGVDVAGKPYQTATLYVATQDRVLNQTNDLGLHGLFMYLNGQEQRLMTWNGQALGLKNTQVASGSDLVHTFCETEMNFWKVEIGFGTVAQEPESNHNPAFAVVGRQLHEGEEVEVRFDVCRFNEPCQTGLSTTVKVHIK